MNIPAKQNPPTNHLSINRATESLFDFSNSQELAIMREANIVSPIPTLLCIGCPATIVGTVIAVVVAALYGKPCRPLAHVMEERFKAIPPCRAYCDAPSPIIRIAF